MLGPTQDSIDSILGVRAVMGTSKYLGLPSMIGRSKESTFGFIKDRIWHKINSWSSKCLSKAGREVLIKSVLQSIPSYIMSVYLLPNKLVDAIEKMINAFWCGHGGTTRKGLHWLSWERLSVHKNNEGMGFKDLTSFNVAMLGKQGWKFQNNTSLVCHLFKERYFPPCDFLSLGLDLIPAMFGEVYLALKLWLNRVLDEGLVLVLIFLCLVLRGLKTVVPSQHKALFMRHLLMSKFKTLSNHRQRFGMLL